MAETNVSMESVVAGARKTSGYQEMVGELFDSPVGAGWVRRVVTELSRWDEDPMGDAERLGDRSMAHQYYSEMVPAQYQVQDGSDPLADPLQRQVLAAVVTSAVNQAERERNPRNR